MRNVISILAGAALMLGSASAMAQEFGSKGDLAFGAERLFAIHSTHVTAQDRAGNGNGDATYTGFGLGWAGPVQYAPFDVPRLGVDYFFMEHLSLGGALGYASVSHDVGNASVSESAFLLSPRVGYLWPLGSAVGFWLRGGVTYHSYSVSNGGGDENGLALTAEGMFAFIPTPHFAFVAGPTFDIDLFGSRKDNGTSADEKYRTIALQFGLMGWI